LQIFVDLPYDFWTPVVDLPYIGRKISSHAKFFGRFAGFSKKSVQ
jgi:hypothetical protein